MKAHKTLYYVHDPMCSWCYGFAPVWREMRDTLAQDTGHEIEIRRVLGGLASDSDDPMAPEMRFHLQQTWHRIEKRIPGTQFNFDFWIKNDPRRSTWPACRAVIAARRQAPEFDESMTEAIQRAYYRDARNPSDRATLVELASEIGADSIAFAADLDSADTKTELETEMETARAMGADSFPSLIVEYDGSSERILVDYRDTVPMLDLIHSIGE